MISMVEKQIDFDDWSGDKGKLKKLNVLAVEKISQKIDLVTKEHNFFKSKYGLSYLYAVYRGRLQDK